MFKPDSFGYQVPLKSWNCWNGPGWKNWSRTLSLDQLNGQSIGFWNTNPHEFRSSSHSSKFPVMNSSTNEITEFSCSRYSTRTTTIRSLLAFRPTGPSVRSRRLVRRWWHGLLDFRWTRHQLLYLKISSLKVKCVNSSSHPFLRIFSTFKSYVRLFCCRDSSPLIRNPTEI